MISFNKIPNFYNTYNCYLFQSKNVEPDTNTNDFNCNNRETYTTWKYDEEGNIVYYTYDKKTGEIISKTKYKNPYKLF